MLVATRSPHNRQTALALTANRALWAFLGIAAWQGLTFLTLAVSARLMPVVAFGQLMVVVTAPTAFGAFVGSALSLAAMRYVGEWRASEPEKAARVISFAIFASVGIGSLAGLALAGSAGWTARVVLRAEDLADELRLAGFVPLLVSFNGALTGALSALNALKVNAAANFAGGIVFLLLAVVLVIRHGVLGVVIALVAGLSVMCLASHMALMRRAAREGIFPRWRSALSESKTISRFATPAVLSTSVVQPAIWIATTQLLHGGHGYGAVALFQSVYRIEIGLTFAAFAVGQSLLPLLSEGNRLRSLSWHSVNALASWTVGLPFIFAFISFPELMTVVFGTSVDQAGLVPTTVFVMLGASFFLFGDGLARLIAVKDLMWWSVASNLLWVGALLLLNRLLGHLGAAGLGASFFIAYVFNTTMKIPFSIRRKLLPAELLLNRRTLGLWMALVGLAVTALLSASLPLRAAAFLVSMLLFAHHTNSFFSHRGQSGPLPDVRLSAAKRPLFLLRGSYGPSNLGDDLLMIGTARCLATHFPGDTILIEAKDPKLARKLAPDLKFTPRVRGTRSRARFTILGGGGQFFWFPRDQAAPRFRRLVKTGNAMPPTTVTDYIGAPLSRAFGPSGHRKFAFCIGVGPFDGNPTREAMIATKLKTFSYISVRDARSAAYFRQWGLPAPPIFTDPIFLADHWLPAAETSGGRERDGSILFVPRAWPYRTIGATHFKAMLEAATQLSSAGWKVKFAVFDRVTDAPLLPLIASRYEVATWDPRRCELPAFIEELAHSGVIVSSRAHGIYLAALLGIPSVAVVIEPKLGIVQATFARSSAAWDHPFHAGQLLSLVADVSTRNRTDAFYDTALHRARAIDAEKDLVRHIHAQLP